MLNYFPKYFTSKAIILYVILLFICILSFSSHKLSFLWIGFGFIEVFVFFYFSNYISKVWKNLSTHSFEKQLFWKAFIIRLFFVFFAYFFFNYMNGTSFEFEAADSGGYHNEALWIIDLFDHDEIQVYVKYIGNNYADMGYPTYLAIVYYLTFKSIIAARIIKALLGAYTCIMIYKIASSNFGESTGRLAGIMAMLFPNLIYYCGLHVKETEMVFLVVLFIHIADKVLYAKKLNFRNIIILVVIGAMLFLFRTVLAVCLIASFFVAIFFITKKVSSLGRKVGLILLMCIISIMIISSSLGDVINGYIKTSDQNLTSQMQNYAKREDGNNKLAKYGSKSIFMPLMLVGPLPTLVDTGQLNTMMLSGGFFTRNIYAFFVFVALIVLYKKKLLRKHIFLLSALFSYLFVLGSSGFALSERFHLPAVPILLIFTAYGISQMNKNNKKYYIPYLIFISAIIIGWNWFKLAGRT